MATQNLVQNSNNWQNTANSINASNYISNLGKKSQDIRRVNNECLQEYKKYLDDVILEFRNTQSIKVSGLAIQRGFKIEPEKNDDSIIKDILKNMMFSEEELKTYLIEIEEEFKKLALTKVTNTCSLVDETKRWVDCFDTCQTTITKLLNMEINSIAYLLRVINSSNIKIISDNPLSFTLDKNFFGNKKLTPDEVKQLSKKITWDIFSSNLRLNIKENISIPSTQQDSSIPIASLKQKVIKQKKTRLIMGFGPSASGKTYSAKSIITMLKLIDDDFPQVFMTIDGGIYREKSILYRFIVNLLKAYGLSGLNNMKISSLNLKKLKLKTLFNSTNIKKIISTFLKEQKSKGLQFSLYIPETLGKCNNLNLLRFQTCKNQYDKYIKLTGDENWIGLYIYQHIHDSECIYPPPFKCEGTSKAGKSREVDEGKRFSNKAYYTSEYFGLTELIKAPNSYKIHNGGVKGRLSIIEDLNGVNTDFNLYLQDELNISLNKKIYKFIYEKTKTPIPELEGFRYFKNMMDCRIVNDTDYNQGPNEVDTVVRKYLKYKNKYLKLKELAKNLND